MVPTISKNMKVNGKDYPIYYGTVKTVPNRQPNINYTCSSWQVWIKPNLRRSSPSVYPCSSLYWGHWNSKISANDLTNQDLPILVRGAFFRFQFLVGFPFYVKLGYTANHMICRKTRYRKVHWIINGPLGGYAFLRHAYSNERSGTHDLLQLQGWSMQAGLENEFPSAIFGFHVNSC